MTWMFVASVVLRVTVILGVAAGLSILLRHSSAAARHLVWTVAIAASLAVPGLSLALPHWNVRLLPSVVERPVREALTPAFAPAPRAIVGEISTRPVNNNLARNAIGSNAIVSAQNSTAVTIPPQRDRYSLLFLASAMWFAGVLLMLFRLAYGTTRMAWMARSARRMSDGPLIALARTLADSLGVRTPVEFLEGTSDAMPIAWGLARHRVLLPRGASEWPIERQKVVLLHELAHVKRRDCLTQLVAQMACAVYWFNPLAWLAARRLRTEREHACDDLVLASGTRGSDYADHLIDIARALRHAAPPTWAAVAMAHRSQLEGRLMAILDPEVPRRTQARSTTVLMALAFTLFSVIVVLVTPLATTTLVAGTPLPQGAQSLPVGLEHQSLPTPTPTPAPSPSPHVVMVEREQTGAGGGAGAGQGAGTAAGAGAVRGGVVGGVRGGIQGGVQGERDHATADPKVVAALAEALKDSDPEVRKQALMTLARVGAKEAVEPLRAATKDADPNVRKQAIFALGQYDDPGNYAYFAAAVDDTNAGVAEQAAFALGQLGDKRAVGALTTALKSSRSAEVRKQAAFALGQIGDGSAVDGLIAALHDDSTEVREQAVFALGQIGDARASDALTAALKDPSAQVRRQAAFALSQVVK